MPHTNHKPEKKSKTLFRIVMILFGAIMAALSLELLLVPNDIVDGGVVGISIMLSHLTGLKLGMFLFVLNVPFLIIGYKQIGKTFMLSTLLGIIVLSISTTSLHHVGAITNDLLLAAVFGGMFLGAGIGIVIKHGGALDGAEVVAILVESKTSFSVGQVIMFLNIIIFTFAGFIFGWENVAYSIITFFIAFVTIDKVIEGIDDERKITIISNHYEEIGDAIQERLGRGITYICGMGGFKKENIQIVQCIVSRLEEAKLKQIVDEIDENAFMDVIIVAEVRGGRFKKKSIH